MQLCGVKIAEMWMKRGRGGQRLGDVESGEVRTGTPNPLPRSRPPRPPAPPSSSPHISTTTTTTTSDTSIITNIIRNLAADGVEEEQVGTIIELLTHVHSRQYIFSEYYILSVFSYVLLRTSSNSLRRVRRVRLWGALYASLRCWVV